MQSRTAEGEGSFPSPPDSLELSKTKRKADFWGTCFPSGLEPSLQLRLQGTVCRQGSAESRRWHSHQAKNLEKADELEWYDVQTLVFPAYPIFWGRGFHYCSCTWSQLSSAPLRLRLPDCSGDSWPPRCRLKVRRSLFWPWLAYDISSRESRLQMLGFWAILISMKPHCWENWAPRTFLMELYSQVPCTYSLVLLETVYLSNPGFFLAYH